MDSILNSIKKMLGISEEETAFDTDIIMHINSALMVLNQLGVGSVGFSVTGENETWSQFLELFPNLELVKSWLYLKVRLIFDPPTTSFVIEATNRQIQEFEWRISVQVDGATPTS